MESEECVFCNQPLLLEQEETVKLGQKGCNTINTAAEKREDNINVKVGQIVHVKCRKINTNEGYSQTTKIIRETHEPEDPVKRRSESRAFKYDSDCVFCGKFIPDYMFRSSTKKYLAYKVRTRTLQESVKTKCLERTDFWGKKY